MKIERAEWDSKFFNLKVGRCQLVDEDSLDSSLLANWDLIYFFVAPENIDSISILEKCGAYCVDRKVTYARQVIPNLEAKNHTLRSYTSSAFDSDLIELGIEAGQYSRFKIDPRISQSQFSALFTAWVNRSISREFADEVLVTTAGETKITGLITLNRKEETAQIGLLAVNPLSRGLGIGKNLVAGANVYAQSNSCKHLEVTTQEDNVNACRFYEGVGFTRKGTILIYHYWK